MVRIVSVLGMPPALVSEPSRLRCRPGSTVEGMSDGARNGGRLSVDMVLA